MKNVGQTLFRLCGALLLAAGATAIDRPRSTDADGPSRVATAPAVDAAQGTPQGRGEGSQVRLTPGKRAFGIRVNDMPSVAGMIMPNSRVDIMVVIDDPRNPGKRVAQVFMTNMRVLAIGAVRGRTQDGQQVNGAVATIEVTPEEAERLAIAASMGQMQLVLRGSGGSDSVMTSGQLAPGVMPLLRFDTASVKVIRGTALR